jgi:hypothetical protein
MTVLFLCSFIHAEDDLSSICYKVNYCCVSTYSVYKQTQSDEKHQIISRVLTFSNALSPYVKSIFEKVIIYDLRIISNLPRRLTQLSDLSLCQHADYYHWKFLNNPSKHIIV